MTKAQAYRVLGTSGSAGRSRAELLYRQECHQLRLRMMPGMPAAARQSAQAELAKVDAAWRVLQASRPTKPPPQKPASAKMPRSVPANAKSPHEPQKRAKGYEGVTSVTPFSEPVTIIVVILVLLVALVALLANS